MKLATAPERYHTIPEIAEQLQTSARHVYNLIEIGALPAVDIGALQTGSHRRRQLRVTDSGFAKFLQARTAPASIPDRQRPARQAPKHTPHNDTSGPHAA